jgi:hypothetical protein
MSATPHLDRWFATMDSDDPDDVLNQITDDFVMSVQFSKGGGDSAEFRGDRAGLVAYLQQREKGTLVHEVQTSATVDDIEMCLGRTTRGGEFEAQFTATAQIDTATGTLRRLLICRTPEISFA